MKADITILLIAYNGYGKHIDDRLADIQNQTVLPKGVIVVLGKKHGYEGSRDGATFIEFDSTTIGRLRNIGLDAVETEWVLYLSVDDALLPNAIEEIQRCSKDCDAVALKYLQNKDINT